MANWQDEYSSSKSKLEVVVSGAVENEVMPVLNKLQKKKERAMQKKRNEERIINNFCRVGITRSCRSSRPISYTFDEYDKAINEAIRETKRTKTKEDEKNQKKETPVVNKDSDSEEEEDNHENNESTESDSNSSKLESEQVSKNSSNEDSGEEESQEEEESHENNDDNNDKNNENDSSEDELVVKSEIENGKKRGIKKVGGDGSIEEMRNFGAKKRLRQRPNRNTAIESAVVCDSEDESLSENSDS